MEKVYVKWNPLHECVVCVHSSEDEMCEACVEAYEAVKNTGYYLKGDWFKVQTCDNKKEVKNEQ